MTSHRPMSSESFSRLEWTGPTVNLNMGQRAEVLMALQERESLLRAMQETIKDGINPYYVVHQILTAYTRVETVTERIEQATNRLDNVLAHISKPE